MFQNIPLYEIFDDSIMLTDGSFVFSFKVLPPPYEGIDPSDLEQDILRLSNMISLLERYDRSVYLSFITEITRNKKELFDRFKKIHSPNPINYLLADQKVAFYKDRVLRNSYIVLCVPAFGGAVSFAKAIRRSPKVLAETIENAKKAGGLLKKTIENFFLENFSYTPKSLTGKEIWQHLFKMINPDIESEVEPVFPGVSNPFVSTLREQLFLSDSVDEDTPQKNYHYILNGGKYHGVLSLDLLPDDNPPGFGSTLLSKVNFPLRVALHIEIPHQVSIQKKLSGMRRNTNIFVSKRKGSPEVERNKARVEAIDELLRDVEKEKLKIIRMSYSLALFEDTPEKLNEKMQTIISLYASETKTSALYTDYFRKTKAFVSSLGYFPTFVHDYKVTSNKNAANCVPLRGPFPGTPEEPVVLFGNRWRGVTAWTPISKQQNKWSLVIIAPSGSGKSFLANLLIGYIQSMNPFVCVFDLAQMSSYKAVVQVFGGEYLESNPSANYPQTINPLDFPLGYDMPPGGKHLFYERVLSYALSDKVSPVTKEDLDILRKAIKRTFERALKETRKPLDESSPYDKDYKDYVSLRDAMVENALANRDDAGKVGEFLSVAQFAHRQAMPNLEDLAATFAFDDVVNATQYERDIAQKLRRRLMLYTEGAAKKLICGNTNFDITKDFVVINLGYLKDNETLLIPVYLTYREFMWDKIAISLNEMPEKMVDILGREHFLRLQQRPKFLFIDEFHNFNSNRATIEITDKDFRQGRAYGIAVGVITQALKDVFYEKADEKITIFDNAANKIFLRHTSPENPQQAMVDYVVSKTGMGKEDAMLFQSLRKVPGRFSEALLFSEDVGKCVVAIEPIPREKWIATTDKRERYTRDMLVEEVGRYIKDARVATSMVIEALAELYPEGLLDIQDRDKDAVYQKVLERVLSEVPAEEQSLATGAV